jgi:tetratricopeptide (TPR) repeat protein
MKRLLIILFLLPVYCMAQTATDYITSGNTKANMKDYKEAIGDFNRSIQMSPGVARAYLYRANAKGNIGDYTGAVADFTKALELDPVY